MKKEIKQAVLVVILCVVLIVVVPIGIICAFHCDAKYITTSLQEKDILSYYTSVLGLSLTITTFILAYKHTTKRIIHTQEYDRKVEGIRSLEKRLTECFDAIHPIKLKQHRLIDKDDGQYIYTLSYNYEFYKYSVTIEIDSVCCELTEAKRPFTDNLFAKEEIDKFVTKLKDLKGECIKLADTHLEFYSNYISSKISPDDFFKKLEGFDKEIDCTCTKYNDMLKEKERLFNSCFDKIASSSPSKHVK